MKIQLFLVFSLAILATVFARSTEKAKDNEVHNEYELDVEQIIQPISLLFSLIESCSPSQFSFENGPWFLFERLNTDDCKVAISNFYRHLPSISRSLSVISRRFLHENKATEKGEF